MPGTKIINVLKDDSFRDILDLFRLSDAEDIVFVLPKRAKLFRREDHFAAFASEAKRAKRNISVLCSNPDINDLARKYGFTVIAKSKPTASLAAASDLPDEYDDTDEEVRDPNTDAFEDDVEVPSDEKMGISDSEGDDELKGMHVEDEDAEDVAAGTDDDDDDDDDADFDGTDESDDFEQTAQRYGENDMDQYDEDGNLVAAGGEPITAQLTVARTMDGVASKSPGKAVPKRVKVGAKAKPAPEPEENEETGAQESDDSDILDISEDSKDLFSGGENDYIDAVWKEKVAADSPRAARPAPKKGWLSFGRNPSDRPASVMLPKRSSGRHRGVIVAVVVLVVIAAGAVMAFGFGKASVTVVPVSRDLEFQVTVQSSDAFSAVDPLFDKIPGQLFEVTKEVAREFPATGSEDVATKARGKIKVQNLYSSSPQTLIATTRFETSDGRVYRTLQGVSVPGSSVVDGQIVPGELVVDVIADKPGPDYNIEATTFTIPAFREQGLTDRYEQLTGVSEAPISGGALGPSKIVTETDLEQAKATVADDLRSQIEQSFAAQAGDLKLLNGAEIEIGEIATTAEADTAADTFTVSATGTLRTVGFREADLFTLLEEHVRRNWQLTVLPENLDLLFDNIRFAEDRGVLAFDVSAVGKGYEPVDDGAIIEDIRGMQRQAVRDYFRGAENVRASTVILTPVWVRSVPDDTSRITLTIDYENEMGL